MRMKLEDIGLSSNEVYLKAEGRSSSVALLEPALPAGLERAQLMEAR